MSLDFNPIYDLLDDEVSSEVQRIYKMQYYQLRSQIDITPETEYNTVNTLIHRSRTSGQIGVIKGVHFGGYLSEEDSVELANKNHIGRFIQSVSIAGKPQIKCMVRRTLLGTDIGTHAFLHEDFLGDSIEDSGFMRAAIANHIEMNGGELRPSARGTRYFVMYVTYRELVFDPKYIKGKDKFKQAVVKALRMKSDKEKYQELKKVFGHFGYYYPSSITLGGRMVYDAYQTDPSGVWSVKDGIQAVDRVLKKSTFDRRTNIQTIGGSTAFMVCQDWINSTRTNQVRTQFGSLRPMYELLDENQRVQVLKVYDGYMKYIGDFPNLARGIHLDGLEADKQAIELKKVDAFTKMFMLRKFSGQPIVEYTKRSIRGPKRPVRSLSLDIEAGSEQLGSHGFISGAEGAYKERSLTYEQQPINSGAPYHTVYVTCKEVRDPYNIYQKKKKLHLYDEFIQATSQFKECITKALQTEGDFYDKYYALQDVFQQFGYYYPSTIRFGGRVTCKVPPRTEQEQGASQGNNFGAVLETPYKNSGDPEPVLHMTAEPEEINQENINTNDRETELGLEKDVSKTITVTAFENTFERSEYLNAIGGRSEELLRKNVKKWINTIASSQTTILFKGLRPLYELLDDEQRSKVQQIYESVVFTDEHIRYNYLLEMTTHEYILEKDRSYASNAIHVQTAIRQWSFVENEQQQERVCQWGVMLFENADAQWEFQKFASAEESEHNHELSVQETESHHEPKDDKPPTSRITENKLIGRIAIKLTAENASCNLDDPDNQYVRYGDVVRLQFIKDVDEVLQRSDTTYIHLSDSLRDPQFEHMKDDLRKTDLDIQWYKILGMHRRIVPCLVNDYNDMIETDSASDYSEANEKIDVSSSLHEQDEDSVFSSEDMPSKSDEAEKMLSDSDYVRNGDFIAFESLAAIDGGKKLYLRGGVGQLDSEAADDIHESRSATVGWHVQHINEYKTMKEWDAATTAAGKLKARVAVLKQRASQNKSNDQLSLGKAYLYGYVGLDIDIDEALKYLTKADKQGHWGAPYELGNAYWITGAYRTAMDMFEKSTLYPTFEACRAIGDLYHTGFSPTNTDDHFVIHEDHRKSFLHYVIGAIFGDPKAALTVGEYLEKGRNEDFGIDHSKALRWYEHVNDKFAIPLAGLAVGKLKHAMAIITTDPKEADELHQEAYRVFETAAMSESYAAYMLAMYHLNGWGGQKCDPPLGFKILQSLIESGLDVVFSTIASCYQLGVGVILDLEKASIFRELASRMDD
ncbi:hypothetical protein DFQ30_005712 [Apophysomyces sp. BC1015]|nr:hypothetical protein DFQ30_005712 [Apophysomyces sp. BC1015]